MPHSANQRNNIFTDTTLDPDLAVGTLTSVPYSYTWVTFVPYGAYAKTDGFECILVKMPLIRSSPL